MQDKRPINLTPIAILGGSLIIALALYFGLKSGTADKQDATTTSTGTGASTSATMTAGQGSAASAPIPKQPAPALDASAAAALRVRAFELAKAEVEKHRKLIVEQCWTSSTAPMPNPPISKSVLNFSFSENGKTLARGIVENREAYRSGVAACVSEKLPEITLPPLGESVYVEVPLTLPEATEESSAAAPK